jgi:hypothetical protein
MGELADLAARDVDQEDVHLVLVVRPSGEGDPLPGW